MVTSHQQELRCVEEIGINKDLPQDIKSTKKRKVQLRTLKRKMKKMKKKKRLFRLYLK